MDDRQPDQARMPKAPRYVTERQLRTTLDESLWEVERRRVHPEPESGEKDWRPPTGSSEAAIAPDPSERVAVRA
jgi:hypothetical protein